MDVAQWGFGRGHAKPESCTGWVAPGLVLTPWFLGPGQGVCPWRSQRGDGEGAARGCGDRLQNHSCSSFSFLLPSLL
ncbi:Vinculin [Dissostichus eleginoides]|uniref:Vinculin n=1 Tax=Dissostichus eleginoides TaxID=100907 RepID=A0AAD9FBI9_DISEL|nr:Vinculin [Dissostichus eleginoides]